MFSDLGEVLKLPVKLQDTLAPVSSIRLELELVADDHRIQTHDAKALSFDQTYPVLHFAVAAGAVEEVILGLLALGSTLDIPADGASQGSLLVLVISVLFEHHELTRVLLAAGADPCVVPEDLYLPDMAAMGYCDAEACAGGGDESVGGDKGTAVLWTKRFEDWEPELKRALIVWDKYWLTRALKMKRFFPATRR